MFLTQDKYNIFIHVYYIHINICIFIAEGSYKDVCYYLYDKLVMHEIKGSYLITGGGYQQHQPVIFHPLHSRNSVDAVFWSEWVECFCKDVECKFGILKKRFKYLKLPTP